MAKPSLVGYRRTSSDMDTSSTDEEGKSETHTDAVPSNSSKNNGTAKNETKIEECSVKDNSSSKDDRLRDDRRDTDKKDRNRRERRKEFSDGKSRERSGSTDRRKRKSPERSQRRHRSRSPGRRKHSDRKRSHSPEQHRSRKSRRSSRSPESFRSKRLERKVARIDKLGLEVFSDLKTGQVPAGFYNAGGGNPTLRITEQIQKRRLLWGGKKETPTIGESESSSKTWQAATFKGDNDGKMTEKFKRLMGMKGDAAPATTTSSNAGSSLIQKQEEMFSKMEAEYQVARMATHTHRGIGLGFGTFQVPPR